jgi:hypothetical protein
VEYDKNPSERLRTIIPGPIRPSIPMLQKRVRLGEFHRIQSITKGLKGIEVIYLQSSL